MISNAKKTIAVFIMFLMIINEICLFAYAEDTGMFWYVRRTKDHSQPKLPSELSFVEEFEVIYADTEHSSNDDIDKRVYLTFDVGYENGNVEKILDILKDNNVSAAFFVLSHIIDTNPELIIRMKNEGHLVCNHTATHKDMSEIDDFQSFKKEIETLENKYTELTGENMAMFFRPPEGKFNRRTLEFVEMLNYRTVFWSFAYEDWDNNSQPNREAAKKKILDNIHNGAILLLHPTSKTNAEILGEVISELKSLGYTFGTLDEIR